MYKALLLHDSYTRHTYVYTKQESRPPWSTLWPFPQIEVEGASCHVSELYLEPGKALIGLLAYSRELRNKESFRQVLHVYRRAPALWHRYNDDGMKTPTVF